VAGPTTFTNNEGKYQEGESGAEEEEEDMLDARIREHFENNIPGHDSLPNQEQDSPPVESEAVQNQHVGQMQTE
jgi:hypothetical protein